MISGNTGGAEAEGRNKPLAYSVLLRLLDISIIPNLYLGNASERISLFSATEIQVWEVRTIKNAKESRQY